MCVVIDKLAEIIDANGFEEFNVVDCYNNGDSISADCVTNEHPEGVRKRITVTVEEA